MLTYINMYKTIYIYTYVTAFTAQQTQISCTDVAYE